MRKTSGGVRIYTRRGADWTNRFPAIVGAATKIKAASFYLYGEGVVWDADGVALFDKLIARRTIMLCMPRQGNPNCHEP